MSHLAGLGQRASPNVQTDCVRWQNHQTVIFGRRTALRNVCYRMSNEHRHEKRTNERMKRTNNKCLPDTTNIQQENNEQTEDIYRIVQTHTGQLPHIPHMSLRFKFSSMFG